MAQRISADAVIQLFAGEDPGSLSESMFNGSDNDLGMDSDFDGHESESEHMDFFAWNHSQNNKTKKARASKNL